MAGRLRMLLIDSFIPVLVVISLLDESREAYMWFACPGDVVGTITRVVSHVSIQNAFRVCLYGDSHRRICPYIKVDSYQRCHKLSSWFTHLLSIHLRAHSIVVEQLALTWSMSSTVSSAIIHCLSFDWSLSLGRWVRLYQALSSIIALTWSMSSTVPSFIIHCLWFDWSFCHCLWFDWSFW